MVCKDTLRIKHLPKELTDHQKEDFVKHFGAYKVKIITSKAKSKSVVYAKFENEEVAKNVMSRLHQITILNCRLCVEFAETDILQGQLTNQRVSDERTNVDGKLFKSFINKIHAFNDSVGFHQPPPSHLKYNYPKANRPTINNIAHALATVPRFYTQVLHLMNKMNLPPPFAVPEPPVRVVVPGGQAQPVVTQKVAIQETPGEKRKATSSEESELESDEETNKRSRDIIPVRQVVPKKTVKRPKFIKQPQKVQKDEPAKAADKPEDVFEMVQVQPPKKIELKVLPEPELMTPETTESEKLEEPKAVLLEVVEIAKPLEESPSVKPEEPKSPELKAKETEVDKSIAADPEVVPGDASEDEFPCISLEELAANQITDLTVMPVFKNYNPGEPTNKLYIKNCAKTVVVQDLEYIFNRYREEMHGGKPSEFNIRLMQEGRMKGQAFVTLDSVEQAQRAVKETNGFILKDKPLVVVFGKAGKKK
ncbi:RNA-binding region-containing protein 3-like [Anthonomus grandis grandis]|uniref:RNA-binding region-containing protein 3-like n=1 Tax=Anthonomus grandis grandis TaxID=2921223 RepID=UPI0021667403|nr:RNA-binding region-containing protein 3-like [Anthonomus grandis grandis]